MGICMSAEDKAEAAKSRAIDLELQRSREISQSTVKLLLLGAGESGKSTLVKQMKIIHGDGYSTQELTNFKPTIIDNLVHSMRAVLEAMGTLKINLGQSTNKVHVKTIFTFAEAGVMTAMSTDLSEAIKNLWADSGVQTCFRRSSEYQLNDSASYYFDAITRISAHDYMPTQQDVLRARVRTTGILETQFRYRDLTYRMFDVGGQRSERRKWIECFDDVTAVIFVTSLSEYNLKLFEDGITNRVHESLTLFEAICNNKFFKNTAMILFLNKTDLFATKIATIPLKDYFPEYEGAEGDAAAAKKFILNLFKKLNKPIPPSSQPKPLYEHFTCATDTTNIRHVFDAVSDILVSKHLQAAGLHEFA
eukprot:m.447930 g.447930  ORF g.447930 m.447930 type:complete len:363 (+) comp56884_c0_seq4:674-1762(+)